MVHKHIDKDKALKDKYMRLLHEAMKDWRMLSFIVGSQEGSYYLCLHWADLKSSILNQLERNYVRQPLGETEPFYDEMVRSNGYRSLLPCRADIKDERSEGLLTQEIDEWSGVSLFLSSYSYRIRSRDLK